MGNLLPGRFVPRRAVWVLLGLAILYGAAGCGTTPTVAVELDAFSGRSNPTWDLSSSEASELMATMASLPPVRAAVSPPGLGYRGFLVSWPGQSFRVYKGYVIAEDREVTDVYRDTAGIEGRLARDARGRGYGAAVKDIGE